MSLVNKKFTNVPIKFFTSSVNLWNKEATKETTRQDNQMLSQTYKIVSRAPGTVAQDAIGCIAIVVMLIVALSLPGVA